MESILRNLSLLAFLVALVAASGTVLKLIFVTLRDPGQLLGEFLACAIGLVGIAVGYGLLLRFLALCDDIAALRRAQTGTSSSLD